MIIYLDSSVLVKRYVREEGSREVGELFDNASTVITNLITRAEVAAAFRRAARMGIVTEESSNQVIKLFRSEWESYQRLPVTEATVHRADLLVTDHDLCGYDAVHLAAALLWQETLGEIIYFATFDRQLRTTAKSLGFHPWPLV